MINFSFMPKIIRILRSCSMKIFGKFQTVNYNKLNILLSNMHAKNSFELILNVILNI